MYLTDPGFSRGCSTNPNGSDQLSDSLINLSSSSPAFTEMPQPAPLASQSIVVEQRIAYNPYLHLMLSSPQSASAVASAVISVKRGQ